MARGDGERKKRNIETALFVFIICGAEGETRQIERFDPPYPTNLLFLNYFLNQSHPLTFRSV
jgi:hypothetical protein